MNFASITPTLLADLLGVSRATIASWERKGRLSPHVDNEGRKVFRIDELMNIPTVREMVQSPWNEELQTRPKHPYTSIELFAGAGGLALGMEKAGFQHLALNEIDREACATLRANRPNWNVMEGDIRKMDFSKFAGHIDLLTGGFPCQTFSYAGKRGGFNDTRGTLFFELARVVKETQPKILMCENVKGLASHDGGRTLETIENVIAELGYTLISSRVLQAIKYQVPQKRERLIMIAVRNDLAPTARFTWPAPYHRIMTLRDALFKGELFDTDVPPSPGQKYPEKKRKVISLVPMGGDWRDLPLEVQKEYMGKSFHLGGGKTGMARRLSLYEPSLTLTCSPAQKQTERCHPTEDRPLSLREYARIQTFPDDWEFCGSLTAAYKQIGNAVPVNLSYAIGRAIVRMLNTIS